MWLRFVFLAGLIALLAGCGTSMLENKSNPGRRDINAVLSDHDKRLMAMSGVVGVYVGLLEDGKTPCLKVMLRRADEKLERSLPRVLEGYRVVTEVTGEIRPLNVK
jgi:hypothetical protein